MIAWSIAVVMYRYSPTLASMRVSVGLHRREGKALFDWIRLYLDVRLRVIVMWLTFLSYLSYLLFIGQSKSCSLAEGVSQDFSRKRSSSCGGLFLFAQMSAPADQSPDRPSERGPE